MWRAGTVVLVLVVGAIFSKAVEGAGFASGVGGCATASILERLIGGALAGGLMRVIGL